MTFNPLKTPWGAKKKAPEPEGEKVPNFIGVRNEVVRDSESSVDVIIVEVRSIKGVPNGLYKLTYYPGQSLGRYLTRLKLKRAGIYSALRDSNNPDAGRLRLSYIPRPDSHIVLGSSSMSSATQFQRSNEDAQDVARNMGRAGPGPSPKIVERPLK